MNKIIYLKTATEVAMGSTIDLSGIKLKITEDLVKDNPDLFEVVEEIPEYIKYIKDGGNCANHKYYTGSKARTNTIYKVDSIFTDELSKSYVCTSPSKVCLRIHYCEPSTKEEYLLQEAHRMYPKGTRYNYINKPCIDTRISSGKFKLKDDIIVDINTNSIIYQKETNNWANIVKPLFKSEDGVDIYEGDIYYIVYTDKYIEKENQWKINISTNTILGYSPDIPGIMRFSNAKAANKWLKENRPEKTLQDYENILLHYKTPLYVELKEKEPKLYWLKVLELIAEDYKPVDNTYWTPMKGYNNEIVSDDFYFSNNYRYVNVKFNTKKDCDKAIKLIGVNLGWIFE